MSLKEYDIDDSAIDEWLPWGGLIRPGVMRNKDDSFLGVIEYTPYIASKYKKIKDRKYQNGWSFWTEKQHRQGVDQYFLTVSWNPFYTGDKKAENTLTSPVKEKNAANYFAKEMEAFVQEISEVTACHLLVYQEILDYLSFTLSLGEKSAVIPEIPFYLDALLTMDLDVNFLKNDLYVDDKKLLAITLPSVTSMSIMNILYKAFDKIPYRHVQRLLIFNKKAAQEDLEKYAAKWCSGRKSLRKIMLEDILENLNGYYSSTFLFLIGEKEYEHYRIYCQEVLNTLEIPYLFEQYNLKDVWWGSLPGIFRANINAPIVGFSHLDDLLIRYQEEKEEPLDV